MSRSGWSAAGWVVLGMVLMGVATWFAMPRLMPVSYTHLTLPTTPYV
jgi:hypothetical protein